MGRRIIILCDGTWNRADRKNPTNVVRFAQALGGPQRTDKVQVPIYVPGVGTGRGVNKTSKISDQILGGMLGAGLLQNIADAYQHLVFLYEPGDELYILGFSRGAYTARSLTGLIRCTGIIRRDALDKLPDVIKRYRTIGDETTHPDHEESHKFRLSVSPDIVTSPDELKWRLENGHADLENSPALLRIKFLGVWDSVGALGIPRHLSFAGWFNRGKYEFHDAELSSLVEAARHAVALDERRTTFTPTRWTNVETLNERFPSDPPDYQEKFFLGDHGSVGGGGEITKLSNIALTWMIEGAHQAGLDFDMERVKDLADAGDYMGPLRNSAEPLKAWEKVLRLASSDRKGPSRAEEVHASVLKRVARNAEVEAKGGQPHKPASLGPLVWPSIERAAVDLQSEPDETRFA